MARIEKTVFSSYGRKDISWALAVYQFLTSQQYDVFFDYTSISSWIVAASLGLAQR